MQENDVHIVKEKVRYLDPYAICEVRHNFPSQWGDNHDKLAKHKKKKDKRVKRVQQHKKAMRRVSDYTAYMMLKWQDRHYIWAPYNFQGHWIAFMIQPKNGVVTVFDSLDYDQSTYKEFIFILKNLIRPRLHSSRLHEQQLLNICRLILHEVVNLMGTDYHPEHKLAQEDKYVSLREWEN
ncbi:hypothetical protein SETIT_2G197300v2 [Setaria italica]|uniref:Ubiquitin-like protease family profile domain-containing protein n=1 Tax=Setaria italica TaxID=4555 RepID=A0A368Q0Z3_SETIT|nr:hypothetical protein SETIT_2G197300v2 [Setaria italica]